MIIKKKQRRVYLAHGDLCPNCTGRLVASTEEGEVLRCQVCQHRFMIVEKFINN